jgi:hypothetical protein
MVKKEIL